MPLRFAAADFPCMSAFHVSSACTCRMENEVHPSQIRFKPCDEMHLVFRFPTRPTLCALAAGQLAIPLLSCRLQPDHSCLCMAFHNLSSVRVSIWLLGFSCSTSRWCGQPTCLMYTLPALLHLATWCIPCHTDAMHRNHLFSVLRALSAAGSGSFAGGSPEPVALVCSLQTALLGQ